MIYETYLQTVHWISELTITELTIINGYKKEQSKWTMTKINNGYWELTSQKIPVRAAPKCTVTITSPSGVSPSGAIRNASNIVL
jgi:hypothetical protein